MRAIQAHHVHAPDHLDHAFIGRRWIEHATSLRTRFGWRAAVSGGPACPTRPVGATQFPERNLTGGGAEGGATWWTMFTIADVPAWR